RSADTRHRLQISANARSAAVYGRLCASVNAPSARAGTCACFDAIASRHAEQGAFGGLFACGVLQSHHAPAFAEVCERDSRPSVSGAPTLVRERIAALSGNRFDVPSMSSSGEVSGKNAEKPSRSIAAISDGLRIFLETTPFPLCWRQSRAKQARAFTLVNVSPCIDRAESPGC